MTTGAQPDTGEQVEQAAHDGHDSRALDVLSRLGIGSRGLVWLLVAVLSAGLLVGHGGQADQDGALQALARRPYGLVLLVVLAVGFAGYALALPLSAAVGAQDSGSGGGHAAARLAQAGKAVVYLALCGLVVQVLRGSGGGQSRTTSLTGRVMHHSGGRVLVGLVGAAVVVVGLALAVRALGGSHAKKIEEWKVPDGRSRSAVHLGTVGLAGRGLVLALVGGFVVSAAVRQDPRQASGLDVALHGLVQQPFGKVLLGVAAALMLAYALWSFVEAAFHRHG